MGRHAARHYYLNAIVDKEEKKPPFLLRGLIAMISIYPYRTRPSNGAAYQKNFPFCNKFAAEFTISP